MIIIKKESEVIIPRGRRQGKPLEKPGNSADRRPSLSTRAPLLGGYSLLIIVRPAEMRAKRTKAPRSQLNEWKDRVEKLTSKKSISEDFYFFSSKKKKISRPQFYQANERESFFCARLLHRHTRLGLISFHARIERPHVSPDPRHAPRRWRCRSGRPGVEERGCGEFRRRRQ